MATLNLDTGIGTGIGTGTGTGTGNHNSKSIILEGNSPITDIHKDILKRFEVLYISRDFNQSLGGLPSCIKAIRPNIYDKFYYKWHSHMVYKDFIYNQPLDNLHYGLEYLELFGTTSQELRNLPTTLKYLVINWKRANSTITLEYLPENLEVLYLDYIILTHEGILNLPQGLKELYLNGGVEGTICALPNELKVLYLNGINIALDKFIELPAELHTFILNDSEWANEYKHNKRVIIWLFKNEKMPKGLKKCIFPLHYADIFYMMNEYAKEYITDDIDFKFIDIYQDKLLEHIKNIYK